MFRHISSLLRVAFERARVTKIVQADLVLPITRSMQFTNGLITVWGAVGHTSILRLCQRTVLAFGLWAAIMSPTQAATVALPDATLGQPYDSGIFSIPTPPGGLCGVEYFYYANWDNHLQMSLPNTADFCALEISGTPSQLGTETLTVVLYDEAGTTLIDTYHYTVTTLAPITQTITGFTATPGTGTVNASSTLSVTGSGGSGKPVTYGSSTPGICSIAGNTVSYLAAGNCTVTANQAGINNYLAAPQVSLDITVGQAAQAITGLAATPGTATANSSSTLSITGSGTSGNPVSYASSTPGICSVSGNTVSYLAAGNCTVTADQAGNSNYFAASQLSLGITVGKASQTLTGLAATPGMATVNGSSTLSVTGSGASGNPVGYASGTPGICSVSGNTVSYLAAGNCTVTADQAGNSNYFAASQLSLGITVGKASQTLTSLAATPGTATANGSSALSVTGSGASGNPVIYGSTTPGTCSVSGNTVSYLAAGTCTVTADQASNANYDAAPELGLSITVTPALPSISKLSGIPTLGQWALIMLSVLVGGLGAGCIRRN